MTEPDGRLIGRSRAAIEVYGTDRFPLAVTKIDAIVIDTTDLELDVEDWIALLVANHLFAASEAFVAASLWDVNARVTVSGNRSNLLVGARIEW